MGNITLDTRIDGVPITSIWFNALRDSIINTIFARNAIGAVESSAGSIGTSAYRFSKIYVSADGSINFGNSKLYESGGEIFLFDETSATYNVTDKLKDITKMITLSGLSEDATNLGVTSDSVIKDNRQIKQALQDIETVSIPDCLFTLSDPTLRTATTSNTIVDSNSLTFDIPRGGAFIYMQADFAVYKISTASIDQQNLRFYLRDGSNNYLTGPYLRLTEVSVRTLQAYTTRTLRTFVAGTEGQSFTVKATVQHTLASSDFESRMKNVIIRVIGF